MSSISSLLEELEEDTLFINDIVLLVSPSIREGDTSLMAIEKLISAIHDLKSIDGLQLYSGPEGLLIRDMRAFISSLKERISSNNYAEVAYAFWIDYSDERRRKFVI